MTTFTFSDKHITDFHTLGYTVFRDILPTSLIRDLRRACDQAREIARRVAGPQAQRLQPLAQYDIPLQPFRDYAELPELCDAIHRLLSPNHQHGNVDRMAVLFEPAEHPWCTEWHRDWRDHMPAEVFEEEFRADWDRQVHDLNFHNQINCPLYDDNCTWFVPGSHYRQQNTAGELAARPLPPAGATAEELERANLHYCQNMPGAVQLCLNAGDFALYRPTGWHLGNYVPYRKRATLHDGPLTPELRAYLDERGPRRAAAMKRWEQCRQQRQKELV